MSVNMYMPAFPDMATEFGVGIHQIEITLSAFILGFAAGPLFYGALSDRYGRLSVLTVGVILYIVMAVLCALETDAGRLVIYRVFQGIGGSAAPVLARASVRDLYRGKEAASVLSLVQAVMLAAPLAAPLIGGLLLLWFDWRSNFWIQAVFAAAILVSYALVIGEPHPPDRRVSIRDTFKGYANLVQHRRVVGFILTSTICYAGLYAFFTESPFVFIELYTMTPQQFAIFSGAIVIPMIGSSYANSRLVQRIGIDRMLTIGVFCCALPAAFLAFCAITGLNHLLIIIVSACIYFGGLGLIQGNCIAGVLNEFPENAGAGAALISAGQFGCGAAASALVSWAHDGTTVPMFTTMAVTALMSFTAFFIVLHKTTPSTDPH